MRPAVYVASLVALAALAALVAPVIAQAPPSGGEPNTPARGRRAERDKPALVSADEIRANEKGDGIWELIGDTQIVQGDATIYAQYCVWNRNNDTAVLTQGVRIVDPTNVITSDRCDIDFDKETAVLTGNVKIVTQNKDKPSDYEPNPDTDPYEYGVWTTTCDRLEYNYGTDKGIAQGNIRCVSEDGEYTLLAEVAYYELTDNDDEVITLPNNPRVVTPDGEEFTCEKAVITVPAEEKTRTQFFKVRGTVFPNKEHGAKKTEGEKPAGEAAPAPTVPPSAGATQSPGMEPMPGSTPAQPAPPPANGQAESGGPATEPAPPLEPASSPSPPRDQNE